MRMSYNNLNLFCESHAKPFLSSLNLSKKLLRLPKEYSLNLIKLSGKKSGVTPLDFPNPY